MVEVPLNDVANVPPNVFELVAAIYVNLSTVDKFIVRGGVLTTDTALYGAVSVEGFHESLDFMNGGIGV